MEREGETGKKLELRREVSDNVEELESIDVADTLKQNFARQKREEHPLDLSKPHSRRKRDYWIVLCAVNVLLIGSMVVFPGVVTSLFAISGMILFTTGFSWVMWFVLDDY